MRTLMLTQVVPNPPDAGPKIKTHFALRTLAQEHDVELMSFTRSHTETEAAEAMRQWCTQVTTVPLRRQRMREPYHAVRGWAMLRPFLVQRDASRAFERALRRRLRTGDIDVLHADQITMAQYLGVGRQLGLRTVFDAHNAVWELVRDLAARQPNPAFRIASEVEWRLLKRFEGHACRASDLTLAVSAHDRDALASAAGGPMHAEVVPIGIEARDRQPVPVPADASHVLSIATMHYPPNAEAVRWFRDAIWPIVQADDARATFDVVGPRPPADLVDWGAQDPRVTIHGYVEDVAALYADAAVFVVPLRSGSGVRVKVLEAMAAGVPVVSTSIGIEGLEVMPGEHLLVADDPTAFAGHVLDLLSSHERRQAFANAGRRRVLERYDWRVCCQPLLGVYRALANGLSTTRLTTALTMSK
jgi:glycosyltransferase involved in cell wall biosynthesis